MKKYHAIVKYDGVEYADYEVEAENIDEASDVVTEEYNPATIIEVYGKEIRFNDSTKLRIIISGADDEFNDISFPV